MSIGQVISGEKFNDLYAGIPMYKFTNNNEEHFGMRYSTGLNEDFQEFNPEGSCQPGGIYFADVYNAGAWSISGLQLWVRKVYVPNYAKVYIEKMKFKADKILLSDRISIETFRIPEEFVEKAVEVDYRNIRFVDNPSEYLCLSTINKTWLAIKYIQSPSETVCIEVLKKNPSFIEYILKHIDPNPSDAIYVAYAKSILSRSH